MKFHKYQATGNDFILIDNRSLFFDSKNISLIKQLCDRRYGIGGDGLILIQNHPDYDFQVIYFNSDGSLSMCGNGSRCAVKYAKSCNIIETYTHFLAYDGAHWAHIDEAGLVHLKMCDVFRIDDIDKDYFVNTGAPHYVCQVSSLEEIDCISTGRAIRYDPRFQDLGTNVNFFCIHANSHISIRTYEKGVEDETLSCGTGVTAVSLVLSKLGFESPIAISTRGGLLTVSFKKDYDGGYNDIYLIGPCSCVFEGVIHIS